MSRRLFISFFGFFFKEKTILSIRLSSTLLPFFLSVSTFIDFFCRLLSSWFRHLRFFFFYVVGSSRCLLSINEASRKKAHSRLGAQRWVRYEGRRANDARWPAVERECVPLDCLSVTAMLFVLFGWLMGLRCACESS